MLINTHPGDWAAGDRGHAVSRGTGGSFSRQLQRAADLAALLGAGRIHVMAGVARGEQAEATYRDNLAWAAEQAPDSTLTIEPLNADDMPGYFLNDFDQAARIIDDLALPNLGIQFDLWHAARIHGDADAVWARHKARVNHVQIAGFPSRNEPGGGGFDLTGLCADLDRSAYPGWVSAEYLPARATVHGLMWLQALKGRTRLIGA
ncbi:MAG: TIM barrel protein [Paracoccaceae bacterium]